MALEGTLKVFSLADILQLISLQRKTGILTLQSKNGTVTITFNQGLVVHAEPVGRRLEDRLGQVLVKRGIISAEQLERALEIQKDTLQRLGFVLVENGFIEAEELRNALRQQILQTIYRLFRWHEGDYQFRQETNVHFDRENITPLSTETILMEGVRMLDEWPRIQKIVGSFQTIFVPTANAASLDVRSEEDEIELDELHAGSAAGGISPSQLSVLELLDGKRDVSDLVDCSALLEFELCKALASLLQMNLIRPLNPKSTPIQTKKESRHSFATLVRNFLGLICAVVVVLLLLPSILGFLDSARLEPAPLWDLRQDELRLAQIRYALNVYRLVEGSYPNDLVALLEKEYLPEDLLLDSRREPFGYSLQPEGFELRAAGQDGRLFSPDDLIASGQEQDVQSESRFFPPSF